MRTPLQLIQQANSALAEGDFTTAATLLAAVFGQGFNTDQPRDERGRFSSGGGSDSGNSPAEVFLNIVETGLLNNRSESFVVVDAEGHPLFAKTGEQDRVNFTPDEAMRLKGNILTHNHPNGGSLSDYDFLMGLKFGVKEIRAVGIEKHTDAHGNIVSERVRYRMRPSANMEKLAAAEKQYGQRFTPFFKEHAQKVMQETRTELENKVATGKMTKQQASLRHVHETWQKLTPVLKDFGVTTGYSREIF